MIDFADLMIVFAIFTVVFISTFLISWITSSLVTKHRTEKNLNLLCPNCGASVSSKSKFCTNCGAKLNFKSTILIKNDPIYIAYRIALRFSIFATGTLLLLVLTIRRFS